MFQYRKRLSPENEKLMCEYLEYLDEVCGLTKGTIYNHTHNARLFLGFQEKKGVRKITEIDVENIKAYIFMVADHYERTTLQNVRSTLRSFLRYCRLKNLCTDRLVKSVPEMPSWTLKEIPDHMTKEQTAKLLSSFNRSMTNGKRNYAMAILLVHLGLRSCEVAAIELDDIDWRQGILTVRNLKCRRKDQLPLPKAVGKAIVSYIKSGRPKSTSKNIFLCHQNRFKGLPINAKTVQGAMTYQFKKHKLKMNSYGTHIIRRTVAGRMIQNGASLKDIADVLRHRQLDTTKIYTKINIPLLRQVALPWPWAVVK